MWSSTTSRAGVTTVSGDEGCPILLGRQRVRRRLEPGLLEPPEPVVAPEHALDVAVVDDTERQVALAERDDVVDLVRPVGGIRVARPLQVAERAAGAVVAAVTGPLDEGLPRAVRDHDRDAARARMRERRLEDGPQVGLARHVDDRVVGEHDVECAREPERPHVACEVLALGVQRPRDLEHLLRDVGERALEAVLEVARVVAAAGAELQQRAQLPLARSLGELDDLRRLLLVVLGSGQEVEPTRELRVEAHHERDVSRCARPPVCGRGRPGRARSRGRGGRR